MIDRLLSCAIILLFVFFPAHAFAVPFVLPAISFIGGALLHVIFFVLAGIFFVYAVIRRYPWKVRIAGLVSILIAVVMSSLILKTNFSEDGKEHVSAPQVSLAALAEAPHEYFVIDVREPEEYDQGHLAGAVSVPLGTFLNDQDFRSHLIRMARGRHVVFFCHDGMRSQIAAQSMPQLHARIVSHAYTQIDDAGIAWVGARTTQLPANDGVHDKPLTSLPRETHIVIDTTWNQHFADKEGIIGAPIMRWSPVRNAAFLEELGERTFLVVCNSRLSCFYGRLLGARATANGGDYRGYVIDQTYSETLVY